MLGWKCEDPVRRLLDVVAAIIIRIIADRLGYHASPQEIVADNRPWQRYERHQGVHHVWIFLAPYPCVHAAHREAEHELQVINT
jgi:hypothetical protein